MYGLVTSIRDIDLYYFIKNGKITFYLFTPFVVACNTEVNLLSRKYVSRLYVGPDKAYPCRGMLDSVTLVR